MKTSKILLSSIAVIAVVTLTLIFSFHLGGITSNPTTHSEVAVNTTKPERISNQMRSTSNQDSPVQQASLDQSQDFPQRQVQSDLHTEEKITEDSEPVVMTDYLNWTVIANNIEATDGVSVATGAVGVAHRDGMFAVANEGIITHTNVSGSVGSIYLHGEASIEFPGGLSMSSTDTELGQTPEGIPTIRAKKLELHSNSNVTTTIYTK